MLEDGPMLQHDVRFPRGIRVDAKVAEHGTGVDAAIDPQERRADVPRLAHRQRPETAVRVPIFRADAWVDDVRPERRLREDPFGENRLAPGDYEIRPPLAEKRRGLGAVRGRGDDL